MPGSNMFATMPAKRYFEFSEGTSNKFWEVWCTGASLYTRFGKIGSSGQVKVKELASKAVAQAEHDKLVKEKTGKGYKEQGGRTNGKAAPTSEAVVIDPNAPRYVDVPEGVTYLEGMHKKKPWFWQVKVDAKSYVVTTGEIGTEGTSKKTKVKDDWRARWEANDLVDEQMKKGFSYVLTGPAPKRPGVAAVNAQLEASLQKESSDDALAVYADWLQEQGDVRGELAALQQQLAKKPTDKKLAKAIDKLLWDQRAYFYGPLAPYVNPKPTREEPVFATWRAGWIDALELGCSEGYGGGIKVRNAKELIRVLPRVASAKFLRELLISRPLTGGEYTFSGPVEEVIAVLPSLPTLRRLTLGRFDSSDCELSWSSMGSLKKLWPVAQKLEYVKIRAGSMDLGKIDLPECREFRIETGGLAKQSLKSVLEAKWPKLETLSLWFGEENYGCTCKIKDVLPILDGKGFSKVKHLGLKNSELGDAIFANVIKSKIMRQLETLDVSMSHITTETLERDILPHKAAFAKIQKLDLSRCLLDAKGQKLAKTLAKEVNVDRQYSLDDDYGPDYRYAAVGE